MRTSKGMHLIGLCLYLFPQLLVTNGTASAASYYQWQDEFGYPHYGDTPTPAAREPKLIELITQPPLYRVESVIDGDTIVVREGGKVRLLGINAPEVAHRDRAAEPLGDQARQRLQQLLTGKRVYLEFDQQRRDRYGRLLAHVKLEDGIEINALLLREGLARALFLQPNMRHLYDYYRAEGAAQGASLGIWSLPAFQPRPASKAATCIKHFCRLYGKVRKVERKQRYTYLQLPAGLSVSINNQYLPQFSAVGLEIDQLGGKSITVRGWVGERDGKPHLRVEHPLQIEITGT